MANQELILSKAQESMAAVIDALLLAGFAPDGETRTEVVRIPTSKSPLFGQSGGELAKFGGRLRFALPGSNVKATVGARTTAIYRIDGKGLEGVKGIASVNTSNLQAVIAALETVKI